MKKITKLSAIAAMALLLAAPSNNAFSQSARKTEKKIQKMENQKKLMEAQAEFDAMKRQIKQAEKDEMMNVPCWKADDPDWYTGTVSRRSKSPNTLATSCLRAARQNLQQKIRGALKQVTRDYFDQMDINEESTEASHIESASDYIVNQFLNDLEEVCRKQTPADEQGYVVMYMGVRVSKKALVDKLATELSKDKQLELRFNEKTFRDDAMKTFSQDRQDSLDDYKSKQTSQQ
jgi:hypothetical protein